MTATVGIEGLISVAGASDLKDIIDAMASHTAILTTVTDNADVTAFASTPPVAASTAIGISQWSITVTAHFPINAAFGKCGDVTFANGYVVGVDTWAMALSCAVFDTTAFAASCPTFASFAPGLLTGSGSWECNLDSSTSIAGSGTSGSATFRMTDETTVDNTLAASIHSIQETASVAIGSKNRVGYNFVTNGDITAAGDSTLFPAGTIAKPDTTEVVMRAASGKTYTGDAFWSNVGISVPIRGLISVTMTLQGTGTLTIG